MNNKNIVRVGVIFFVIFMLFAGNVLAQDKDIEWVTPSRIGNPEAKTTITFWIERNTGMQAQVEEVREKVIDRMESWARKNPDVKIIIEASIPILQVNEYMVKLYEAAKAGNAPDMACVDSFWLPMFIKKDSQLKQVPQALDQFLTEKELNNYFDAYREFCTDDKGRLRAHPYYTDLRPLWYRKDLVDTPPETWDELIEISKKVMKEHPEVKAGFLITAGRYENTSFNFWGPYWSLGGKLVDEEGKPVFNEGENREKMLTIFRLLKRLVDEGVMPTQVVTLASTVDLNAAIVSSNAIFALCGSWHHASLGQLMGKEEFSKKWAMSNPPVFKKGDPIKNGAGGWTIDIFTDDPIKKQLAFSFLWYVYGDFKGMADINTMSLPTVKDISSDYLPFQRNEYLSAAAQQLKYAMLRPGVEIYPNISQAIQIAFSEVISGSKTPEKALDGAWSTVMGEYNK